MRRVEPTSPASAALRRGDIVLSFDGIDIANDGTVPFRSGERISFSYLVSRKYVGDQARPQGLVSQGVADQRYQGGRIECIKCGAFALERSVSTVVTKVIKVQRV